MPARIPVNPRILKWAREAAGLGIEEVVSKLNRKRVTAETINSWETGDDYPTYPQLERLAYEIYKRPIALFFFPEPPIEETPEQSFRTLPEYEIGRLSPRTRYLVRKARAMQINLSELYDGKNPASELIIDHGRISTEIDVEKLAESTRDFLGVDINMQMSWQNNEEAFKAWRRILEDHGVFIFKDAFKDENISGFCLYDQEFPIIYANNSMPYTRQIFTLFHELCHLFFHIGGIDLRTKDFISVLSGENKKIEVACNQFAGAFLVPNRDFDSRIRGIEYDDESTENLAGLYHVSREVILRKLMDRELISQDYYMSRVDAWKKETRSRSGSGGNYYLNLGVYLGHQYIETAFMKYYQKKISLNQLADYLGVKAKNVGGVESLLL